MHNMQCILNERGAIITQRTSFEPENFQSFFLAATSDPVNITRTLLTLGLLDQLYGRRTSSN